MSLFEMGRGQARVRLVEAAAALAASMVMSGCGAGYRPVVTPISPTGPASQPTSLVTVVSSPSTDEPGIATVLDYSGDTIMAQAEIGPGPLLFTTDESGSTGYTYNSDKTVTNFPISTTLQEKQITTSTLPPTADPVGLFSPSAGLWVADLDENVVDVLTGSPETYKLPIEVAPIPIMVAGPAVVGERNYAISQNTTGSSTLAYDMTCSLDAGSVTQLGEADAIEVSGPSYTISARITLGVCPVYAVESQDKLRLFVLNRGSDTVTVINAENNSLNECVPFTDPNTGRTVTCHSSLPLSTKAGLTGTNVPAVAGPVYAEYNAATEQLVVADYDGGTVSIIDVSMDVYGNDSATFGTTYTVKVGKTSTPYPAAVTVLADGSYAYSANQGDDSGTGNGTVSVINMSSHTLEKTLDVVGHPRTVVSTSNSSYAKIYAASPDTDYVTIIQSTPTLSNAIDTTVLVPGNIVDIRTSAQNGTSGNYNVNSRAPGAGQPCYLPPALMTAKYGAGYSLDECQTLPTID